MARDFATMKSNVAAVIMDTSSEFANLIGWWLNDKYRDIAQRASWSALIDFDYSFDTVANEPKYNLEADFDEEVFVANITDGEPLTRYNEGNWWVARGPAYSGGSIPNTGLPKRYVILREQGKVLIDPVPDDVKKIAMPYKKIITELSGDSDIPVIHDIENIMELGAIGEAFSYKRQLAKADYYFQRYEFMISGRIQKEVSPVNQLNQRIPANYVVPQLSRMTGETPYAI